jgi:hypothetical protein
VVFLIAYVGIVALTLSAALPAVVGNPAETWAATSQPEAATFASYQASGASAPVSKDVWTDLQTLTSADMTAGLRALHRGGMYHTTGLMQIARHSGGYRTFPTIVDQMSMILRKHGAWTAEELKTLKDVIAEQYPHIVIH